MGFDWEHLTPEECDKKHDEMLQTHAKQFHQKNRGADAVPRRLS